MKTYTMTHLVKSEDLNHHRTLYAGRIAEWFIEGCFIAAAGNYGNPEDIVFLKLQDLTVTSPGRPGDIVEFQTRLLLAGNTSLTIYGKAVGADGKPMVEGFAIFVCVDAEGRKKPHGMTVPEPQTADERLLVERARSLK